MSALISIALFEPKIPQNTGNIIRLAANTGFSLHLIGPIDFEFNDKNLKRAGLDYHDMAEINIYSNYDEFRTKNEGRRIWALTTKGTKFYHDVQFKTADILLFGSETSGLPDSVRSQLHDQLIRVPMCKGNVNNRSLNLANTVALVSYEAWRQLGFKNSI
ncbi:MAG TPA: tRNA (cytidine(34)-2'-O)-methyltransferase [Methylophilus sp.]|uniref:tRNA (cytidine(34)-2'-O)-methyltransferase n=1 Tax=Methylophilus sp. TaxID=29541 RepID=UPI002C12F1E1|nr:tRNA (cytidine(34)-2'-O)-methyltransferase [Methylophilus sp.]HSH88222.1 tRNA (cytidine(34)-2'-O)-methyltransferase [Methylophilus sp.]